MNLRNTGIIFLFIIALAAFMTWSCQSSSSPTTSNVLTPTPTFTQACWIGVSPTCTPTPSGPVTIVVHNYSSFSSVPINIDGGAFVTISGGYYTFISPNGGTHVFTIPRIFGGYPTSSTCQVYSCTSNSLTNTTGTPYALNITSFQSNSLTCPPTPTFYDPGNGFITLVLNCP